MSQITSSPTKQNNLSTSVDISQNQQNLYNNNQSLSTNSQNINVSSSFKRPDLSIKIEENEQKSLTNPTLLSAGNNIINIKSYLKSEASQRKSGLPHCNFIKRDKKKPPSELKNPLLINQCKKAIARERKELPNYKEIIEKINTEFGIEDTKKFLTELEMGKDADNKDGQYRNRDVGSYYYENEKNSMNSIIHEEGPIREEGNVPQQKMTLHLRDNSFSSLVNNSSQMTKETQR